MKLNTDTPHRRFNPLLGEWVLVSPHRTKRPWQGAAEESSKEKIPRYDPKCYLCPGNERAGGVKNPPYNNTFVFTNDFSALLPDAPKGQPDQAGLLRAENERGICKVICFSPRHDLTIPLMDNDDVVQVIDTWVGEYIKLEQETFINHVQIFENRGAMMGASNPHPHCQIWANETVPDIPARKQKHLAEYLQKNESNLLLDYLKLELKEQERVLHTNDSFVAVVPFWAVWPFEVMVLPREHRPRLKDLTPKEREDLAGIMRRLTTSYDNLFQVPFPYSMGFHQAPCDGEEHAEWQMHLLYYPPLLRSASIAKHMVGYEMLAMAQRDITAEQACARLREQEPVHYLLQTDR